MMRPHKFMVLGTGGLFTFHVISTLIKKGFLPMGYMQSGQRNVQPTGHFDQYQMEVNHYIKPLDKLLLDQSVPIKYDAETDLVEYVTGLLPDFILVACWPKRLSNNLLSLAKKAAVNLHPSLLPKFRGIDPIKHQLTTPDRLFGISLHLMNERFDEGDIVLQQPLTIQKDTQYEEIEAMAAEAGADLFIHAMNIFDDPGWSPVKQSSDRAFSL